jgi:hypothetical protein
VGTAFMGKDGGEDVIVARPVQESSQPNLKHKRIFVGSVQPSWGLGPNHVIKDLVPAYQPSKGKGKRRKKAGASIARLYVGKRELLFARTAPLHQDCWSPFSSLSPLSESSDDEDGGSRWVVGDSDMGGNGTPLLIPKMEDAEVAAAIQRGLIHVGVSSEFSS